MSFCSVDEINRSLFAFQIETYHWNLSMDAEINDSPGTLIALGTLEQYLGFNTTRKRFEPGHNLFTFPVVHSAPLKYNSSYHRNHISLKSCFIHILNQEETRLIQNLT